MNASTSTNTRLRAANAWKSTPCSTFAHVNAALLDATRVGATSAELFRVAADAYAREGFAGDEQLHHQGGATGYWEREWVATPTGAEKVVNGQVFAWNPSVRGGK